MSDAQDQLPSETPDPVRQAMHLQQGYYETRRPVRMLTGETPYILRHFEEFSRVANLQSGEPVCEWGAGLGRFSRLLARTGIQLDSIELSPTQAAECQEALQGVSLARVLQGDAVEIMSREGRTYSAIVGFFMLHHLTGIGRYLESAARHLKPGGRFVFIEPNPWNPLYPLQITFTPGMRWEAEKGIYELWPNRLQRLCQEAGFQSVEIHFFGSVPRGPYNFLDRLGLARLPEYLIPRGLRPFQLIVATR